MPSSFEYVMRLFFGDKAYHIGDMGSNPSYRNRWLKKTVDQLVKDLNSLESDPEHRHLLLLQAENVRECLPSGKVEQPNWGLVYNLFGVIAYLLGYQLMSGRKYYSAIWHQNPGQYAGLRMLRGQSCTEHYQEKQTAISVRATIANDLRMKGFNDFQISLVLNTTDYEVKRLKALSAASAHDSRAAEEGGDASAVG